MSITTKLQNILDNSTDDVNFMVEVDGNLYDVKQLKVTFEDEEPVEVILVADYD